MTAIQTNHPDPEIAFVIAPELRCRLEQLGEEVRTLRGELVFRQGANCKGVFLLSQGKARIFMTDVRGQMIACRDVAEGSLLGLPATLCQQPYMFTAESREVCTFRFIEAERFQEFLREHPQLCMQVVQLMSSELAVVNRKRIESSKCQHADCALRGTCSSTMQ